MRNQTLFRTILILAFILLSALSIVAQGMDADERRQIQEVNRKTLPFTRSLPGVDKVELIEVGRINEGGYIQSIAATKIFEGKKAQTIASVWRAQAWNLRYSAMCHEPPFAVKFYSGQRVVLYASICWGCRNIVVLEPTSAGQGFAAHHRMGKMLLRFFTEAFPSPSRKE